MPCALSSILFISNLAERSPNGAKLVYEAFFNPEPETFIPAKLTTWQASTPTADTIKSGDSILCIGRAYFDQETTQMLVTHLSFLLSYIKFPIFFNKYYKKNFL